MNRAVELLISAIIVLAIATYLGRTLKLSAKYDRKPRKLSDWNALDNGIDPTEEKR